MAKTTEHFKHPKGGGGEQGRGRVSSQNSLGYRQILSQLQVGREVGSTVGGPKATTSANSSKNCGNNNPQQEHKQEKQQQASESRATNSTNNNPETVNIQNVWVPKVGRGRPVEFRAVVFEAFILEKNKICKNWSLTFSEVLWEGQL